MPEDERPLVDREARTRAARDIGSSCSIEAGAGTGKTTLLVDRFVSIVMEGTAGCRQIVAITFTEKAALEMKDRIRRKLCELAAGPCAPEVLSRLETALGEIEGAPVSTIHSFASSILREYPVEAGLDPHFTQLDEIENSIMLDDCWNEFLQGVEAPYDRVIEGWFRAGGGLNSLRDVAMKVYPLRGRRDIGGMFEEDPAPPAATGREDIRDFRSFIEISSAELVSLLESSCRDRTDEGALAVVRLIESLFSMNALEDDDLEEFLLGLELPKARGNRKNWDPAEACARQKSLFREMAERQGELKKSRADRLEKTLMEWLDHFTTAVEEKKRKESLLDFDDLLIRTRRLLDDQAVLASLRRRYRHILVDEFQDTDSLQAEIVLLLSGRGNEGEVSGHERAGPPSGPEPGKLFIVGDPKQSIYRFRNADVEIYEKVKNSFAGAGSHLKITQNFRSVPGITEWVNRAFSRIITSPDNGFYQPDYEPIHARREGGGAAVVSLRFESDGDRADDMRRSEGAAVAGFVRELIAGGREIMDPVTRAMRPVRFGDVAIIYRGTTGIEYYEDSLRSAGIPYVVEGGKLYYTRQEVRDLSSALWAIEDPFDSVALVASLRSGLFGFTDEELFLFKMEGGSFNYIDPGVPAGEKYADLARAFDLFSELHFARNRLGPAGTFARLLRMTRYLELSILRPHGGQRVRNIRKAVQNAREFSGRLHSYRYFARWFRDQERLSAAEGESPAIDEEENALRMLTMHKAKGLQFPVVILVNLLQKIRRHDRILATARGKLAFDLGGGWETSDFAARSVQEKLKDSAEISRLLYVAATRAGDLLVIPAAGGEGTYYNVILPFMEETAPGGRAAAGGGHPGDVLAVNVSKNAVRFPSGKGGGEAGRVVMTGGEASAAMNRWRSERDSVISRGKAAPALIFPSAFEVFHPDAGVTDTAGKERDETLRFGSAFHRVMELVDLKAANNAGKLADEAALMFAIENRRDELLSLVMGAVSSPLIAGAAASRSLHREMAFSVPFARGGQRKECGGSDPDAMVEGRIDLLFEKNGAWTVVDYKTDDIGPARLDEQARVYRKQGSLYAWALSGLGIDLSGGVIFFFVRAGLTGRLEVTPAMLAETEEMIRSAAGRGGTAT